MRELIQSPPLINALNIFLWENPVKFPKNYPKLTHTKFINFFKKYIFFNPYLKNVFLKKLSYKTMYTYLNYKRFYNY